MVSTLLTAFILMIMIGHQINVANHLDEYENINQSLYYPSPASITSDDHVQVWRWGLIWLPVCILFAWLIAFPAVIACRFAGAANRNLINSHDEPPPDVQFLDTPIPDVNSHVHQRQPDKKSDSFRQG